MARLCRPAAATSFGPGRPGRRGCGPGTGSTRDGNRRPRQCAPPAGPGLADGGSVFFGGAASRPDGNVRCRGTGGDSDSEAVVQGRRGRSCSRSRRPAAAVCAAVGEAAAWTLTAGTGRSAEPEWRGLRSQGSCRAWAGRFKLVRISCQGEGLQR